MVNSNSSKIITLISEELLETMNSLQQEQHMPRYSADESDDLMKFLTQRISKLRLIRSMYEEVTTGAIL